MADHSEHLYTFPEVPEADRPKNLYVMENLDAALRSHLKALGWNPIDVRLLPSKTDFERADAVRSTLEGARMGVISLTQQQQKQLELEARACGLIGTKEPTVDLLPQADTKLLMKDLLNFGNPDASVKSAVGKMLADKTKSREILRGFALKSKLHNLRTAGKHEAAKVLEENNGYLPSIKDM